MSAGSSQSARIDAQNVISFTFRHVNSSGQMIGHTKKGRFDGKTLDLGGDLIAADSITHARRRLDRLALTSRQRHGEAFCILLAITTRNCSKLQSWINQAISTRLAFQKKEYLDSNGEGQAYSAKVCPKCYATIDLSGVPKSAQAYCNYCETIWTQGDGAPPDETMFRVCDKCGLFARPDHFTIVYYAGHSVHWQNVLRCHTCMRRQAWFMVGINFLTIFWFIPSCVLLWRVYRGAIRSRAFRELDKANALAKKRHTDAALNAYDRIAQRLTVCAGIRFNMGLTHLMTGDVEGAASALQESLLDCANYEPAFDQLCRCYRMLDRGDALQELQRLWGKRRP